MRGGMRLCRSNQSRKPREYGGRASRPTSSAPPSVLPTEPAAQPRSSSERHGSSCAMRRKPYVPLMTAKPLCKVCKTSWEKGKWSWGPLWFWHRIWAITGGDVKPEQLTFATMKPPIDEKLDKLTAMRVDRGHPAE